MISDMAEVLLMGRGHSLMVTQHMAIIGPRRRKWRHGTKTSNPD
jgi:hypothetical protein